MHSEEARAIARLCKAMRESGEAEYAVLMERLRDSEEEFILREAAAELMRQPLVDEDIDAEFSGAIRQLQENERKRAFAQLQEKVAKLGVTGLSSDEKAHYVQMLDRGKCSVDYSWSSEVKV
jgi:hypothetical protein